MVFVVADMRTPGAPLGDGKPEILIIEPNTMTVTCLHSDSGYNTVSPVENPTPTNHIVLL